MSDKFDDHDEMESRENGYNWYTGDDSAADNSAADEFTAEESTVENSTGESAPTDGPDYSSVRNYRYDPNGAEDERASDSDSSTPYHVKYHSEYDSYRFAGSESGESKTAESKTAEPKTGEGKSYRSSYTKDSYDTTGSNRQYSDSSMNGGGTNFDGSKRHTPSSGNSLIRKIGLGIALAVLFGLVAALVFIGVTKLSGTPIGSSAAQSSQAAEKEEVPPEIELGKDDKKDEAGTIESELGGIADNPPVQAPVSTDLTVPQVVQLVMPSMVAITNTSVQEYYDFFGREQSQKSVSAGSGIIVGKTDTELLVATNEHVISNSEEITVTFVDDTAIAGRIKGADSSNDLAIVAVKLEDIPEDTQNQISIVSIGDSDSCVVGEQVVAIGNALGYGQSVSTGIVSALNREVTVNGATHFLLQTDASINPGNSGGALLNMKGELIGINEVKYVDDSVEGVGYAIPMATAEPILKTLGSKQTREKVSEDQQSYIGITCIDIPDSYVQAGIPAGVYVNSVFENGPADQAGLQKGDIIISMDDVTITSRAQMLDKLLYYAAGEVVEFDVERPNVETDEYETIKVTITLGNKNDETYQSQSQAQAGNGQNSQGGQNGQGGFGGFGGRSGNGVFGS